MKKFLWILLFLLTSTAFGQEPDKPPFKADYDFAIVLFENTNQKIFELKNFEKLVVKNKYNGTEKPFASLTDIEQHAYILELAYIFNVKMNNIYQIWKDELSTASSDVVGLDDKTRKATKKEIEQYMSKLDIIQKKYQADHLKFAETFFHKYKEKFKQGEVDLALKQIVESINR